MGTRRGAGNAALAELSRGPLLSRVAGTPPYPIRIWRRCSGAPPLHKAGPGSDQQGSGASGIEGRRGDGACAALVDRVSKQPVLRRTQCTRDKTSGDPKRLVLGDGRPRASATACPPLGSADGSGSRKKRDVARRGLPGDVRDEL